MYQWKSQKKYVARANLQPILPPIPLHRRGEVFAIQSNVIKPAKIPLVATQRNPILPWFLYPYTIVCVALCRVKIENEQQPSSLIHNHLVYFMFQRHVRLVECRSEFFSCFKFLSNLWRTQPAMLLREVVHGDVKIVQIFIAQ